MSTFKPRFSRHAREQIAGRFQGLTTEDAITSKLWEQAVPLIRSGENNVHVVIEVLPSKITRKTPGDRHASSGDVIIAAVTFDGFVKTVMLRYLSQCKSQRKI